MLALLFATFIVIPVADEILCAAEGSEGYSYIENVDIGEGSGFSLGHDTCSHGHCHHLHAHAAPHSMTETAFLIPVHQPSNSSIFSSHTPERLKRPPRA